MAAGIIPEPGSKYGPCVPTCKHLDCAALRKSAESLCMICQQRIGYDTRFYQDDKGLEHAVCTETAIENGSST